MCSRLETRQTVVIRGHAGFKMLPVPPTDFHTHTRGGGGTSSHLLSLTSLGLQTDLTFWNHFCTINWLSVQDWMCNMEIKSRGVYSEKTEFHVYQRRPNVEPVHGPFKEQSGWAPLWGPETGAFVWKLHAPVSFSARRWHQQKLHWGSGGVESATHPAQNQNSLGRPRRPWRWKNMERRKKKKRRKQPRTDAEFTVHTGYFFFFSIMVFNWTKKNQEKEKSKPPSLKVVTSFKHSWKLVKHLANISQIKPQMAFRLLPLEVTRCITGQDRLAV